jgi:hypothetical protein
VRWHAVRAFLVGWFEQSFIAVDQCANAVLTPLFTGRIAWADETLSARTHRAAKDGKIVGRLARPVIDWMFAWQEPDLAILGEDGKPITGHCERAFHKERRRANLPPEYRG